MAEDLIDPPPKGGPASTRGTVDEVDTSAFSGFKMTAAIWASFVTLLVGLAWPATVLIVAGWIVHHADARAVQTFVSGFMDGKQSVRLTLGPNQVSVEVVAKQVQSGLTQQLAADGGAASAVPPSAVQRTAEFAVTRLLQKAEQPSDSRMKILWVDDHPQNNIGLQYAFQALGMMVVCIDSNAGIADSFSTAGRFDVVITDMYRDAMGSRPAQPEAGLQTVELINADFGNVPVIIYAGNYSAQHATDPVSPPVLANTNNTQKVFDLVLDIASKKKA